MPRGVWLAPCFYRNPSAPRLSAGLPLHLEAHLGRSPGALRSPTQRLERTIMETSRAWDQEGIEHGELRPIIGAVDETFLQRLMLVFMDLASGYLLLEEVAVDRTYD